MALLTELSGDVSNYASWRVSLKKRQESNFMLAAIMHKQIKVSEVATEYLKGLLSPPFEATFYVYPYALVTSVD